MLILYIFIVLIPLVLFFLHWLSYSYIKNSIIRSRKWCLNLCCGNTDGGGINADVVRHIDIPRFDRLSNIYRLPYNDGQFEWVLCSHTIEHVDDPCRLDRELRRVGNNVVYVLPPLLDLGAVFNLLEHKWVFLTIRKTHSELPRHIKLPGSDTIQKIFGQMIRA